MPTFSLLSVASLLSNNQNCCHSSWTEEYTHTYTHAHSQIYKSMCTIQMYIPEGDCVSTRSDINTYVCMCVFAYIHWHRRVQGLVAMYMCKGNKNMPENATKFQRSCCEKHTKYSLQISSCMLNFSAAFESFSFMVWHFYEWNFVPNANLWGASYFGAAIKSFY